MKKTFHVNEKIISAKYNRRLFLVNLPSLSVLVPLLAIVLIFSVFGNVSIPEAMYRYIFYGTYFCVLYSFVTCLIGSVIADISVKAHKKHTYIEISDSCLILSQHSCTRFCEGRLRSYKKLWIIDLNDIEDVECLQNSIVITAKARYFDQDADWLGYVRTENGVDFDNWWYNSNGGATVHSAEITDYYTNGERIAQRIRLCSEKISERTRKREEYRRRMLEIAGNTNHKRGISDKYKPARRKFR